MESFVGHPQECGQPIPKTTAAARATLIAALVVFSLLLTCIPTHSASAATEPAEKPASLLFSNALDTNIYTERLVYEVFKRMDIDVTFALEDMNVCLDGANAGVYDGICAQAYGIEDDYDQLVLVPFETAAVSFYALTLQEDAYTCSSWSDLRDKRVGSLSGKTLILDSLPDDIASHVETASMSLLYDSLRQGNCDVVVITESSYRTTDQLVVPSDIRVAGVAETRSCGIFLNKKHAALIDQITETLTAMEADGSLELIKAMKPVEDRGEKSILYLSSYSPEMKWEQRLIQGISNVLDQEKDIEVHSLSLNSLQNTNVGERETEALKSISARFARTPPDAVIVSDNEALNFLLNNYNSILPNDIPVIACGLNNAAFVSDHRFDRNPDILGIIESINAKETVEKMLELFPETEEIYVINDYTLTGRRWQAEIETQLEPFKDRVWITYNENTTLKSLMSHISALDENALVLCGSYWVDGAGYYYPQAAFQNSLNDASTVPIFGMADDSRDYGQLGGKYINAISHGEIAATHLVEALRAGGLFESSYLEPEGDNEWVFNWDAMQQYGISANQLPEDSTILNAPVSMREANPALFYTIVIGGAALTAVFVLLIVFSAVLKRRNNRLISAEAESRKAREEVESVNKRLQTTLENAPIAYSLLVDDIVVESNSYYRKNVGSNMNQKNSVKYGEETGYDEYMRECREKGHVYDIDWRVLGDNGEKYRYLYNIALTEHEGQEAIVMWGANIEQLELQKEALNQAHHDIEALTEKTRADSLTGLYTREASRKFIDEYIWVASETDLSAFMIIDLDNFKQINDTFGHPFGDGILEEAADVIKSTFRKSDIMIRIGGDEFAVFLKNIPSREFAINKADELMARFRSLCAGKEAGHGTSVSIGISFFPEKGRSFDALYQAADEALYRAKSNGKNQYDINTDDSAYSIILN